MKEFPGPKARAVLKDVSEYYATNTCFSRIVVSEGNGELVKDVDGNKFYDFHCDASVNNLGRNNSLIRRAIILQLESGNYFSEHHSAANPNAVELAKRLVKKSPVPKPAKVFFSNSGTEANEAARKLCRAYRIRSNEKWRTKAIYFVNGFAGRTKGVIAGTSSKPEHQRDPFWDHCDQDNSIYIPYPSFLNWNLALEAFSKIDLSKIDRVLIELSCQGEGGIIPADSHAVNVMCKKAKKSGVIWIVDAVQCGMGRDGSLFGCEDMHGDEESIALDPDIIILGKALGGGLPIGCTIFRSDLDFELGQHSNTFGGGELVMSAALAAFWQIEKVISSGHIKNVELMLWKNLSALHSDHIDIVTGSRGRGAMWALEFVSSNIRDRIIKLAEEMVLKAGRGLRLMGAGRKSIRIMPPINISLKSLNKALKILRLVILDFKFKN